MPMEYRKHRRGFFTYDLLFAFLTIVITLFFMFSIINSISSVLSRQQNEEKSMKLLLLSDQLVRRDLAAVEGGNAFANKISSDPLQTDTSKYMQDYNVSSVSLSFASSSQPSSNKNASESTVRMCIDRIILLNEGAGVLRVCIE